MDTIKDIWFDANRIYMKTDGGETFSRPLEAVSYTHLTLPTNSLV